jgi:predicted RNase H-like nuclease (RuvC/YqgF family)
MFDFFKRKPSPKPASRALMVADPELEQLRSQVAARQTQAAELEADLMESQESLAAFQREFESRLGPYIKRINDLQAQIEAAQRAAFRRLWADRPFASKYIDVEDQFRTAWTQTDTGAPPPPPPPTAPNIEAEIKVLYRELAKRYHPDLGATEAEREWRTPRMAAVNAAYAARNLAALQKLAALADSPEEAAPILDSRAALLDSLRREIERLDELILKLERDFDELSSSPALQMQLNASMAKRAGRDLIREAIADLQKEITQLEQKLKEAGG